MGERESIYTRYLVGGRSKIGLNRIAVAPYPACSRAGESEHRPNRSFQHPIGGTVQRGQCRCHLLGCYGCEPNQDAYSSSRDKYQRGEITEKAENH